MGMNVKVGFPTDLLSSDMMPTLIFPVHQQVAKFQVFDENDRGRLVDDILQPLFALAQSFFRQLALCNARNSRAFTFEYSHCCSGSGHFSHNLKKLVLFLPLPVQIMIYFGRVRSHIIGLVIRNADTRESPSSRLTRLLEWPMSRCRRKRLIPEIG